MSEWLSGWYRKVGEKRKKKYFTKCNKFYTVRTVRRKLYSFLQYITRWHVITIINSQQWRYCNKKYQKSVEGEGLWDPCTHRWIWQFLNWKVITNLLSIKVLIVGSERQKRPSSTGSRCAIYTISTLNIWKWDFGQRQHFAIENIQYIKGPFVTATLHITKGNICDKICCPRLVSWNRHVLSRICPV